MELKSLIIGLALSVGIFAVKSGAGLSFLLQKATLQRQKFVAGTGYIIGYGLVFALAWFIVSHLDFTAKLDRPMLFFKNGMTLHFTLALLLMGWGLTLLRQNRHSHGWLLKMREVPRFNPAICQITITKRAANGDMQIITKKGRKIVAIAPVVKYLKTRARDADWALPISLKTAP